MEAVRGWVWIFSGIAQFRFLPNCTNFACQFKWLSVRQNIEEYIPVLVIGSDGPPKPKKN